MIYLQSKQKYLAAFKTRAEMGRLQLQKITLEEENLLEKSLIRRSKLLLKVSQLPRIWHLNFEFGESQNALPSLCMRCCLQ